jgi:hypothetical protein
VRVQLVHRVVRGVPIRSILTVVEIDDVDGVDPCVDERLVIIIDPASIMAEEFAVPKIGRDLSNGGTQRLG